MFKKAVWGAMAAAVFAGALMADDPTITADATSVKVSVPAGYAPGAKLVLACAAADRGTQLAAWATTRELCAEIPAEGGEFSATLADLGFSDGNCVVRAFFSAAYEKLDYLIVDAANEYTDPGVLDTDVYGIEYGYTPKGGAGYGKMICALAEGGPGTEFRFEGAASTEAFNFCADNLSGAYQFKGARLNTGSMNTVVARNSAITVNGTKLGDFRTAPIGLKGARVRLNSKNPDSASDPSYGWWYYLKLYGRDGRLLVDYIPTRRVADGVIGFYDRAEKRFVTPSGEGEFTAGPTVMDGEDPATFTDVCAITPAVDIVSRSLALAVENGIATVTVPAGFATGEKLYLVADEVDRGASVEGWLDVLVLSETIPAEGGTFTCTCSEFCSSVHNQLRAVTAEDFTRLVSLTANEVDDYRDTGVADNVCYGIEYGYQPINGADNWGKTLAAVGGGFRLERAAGANSPSYNYCACDDNYAQVTLRFDLNGNDCNLISFFNHELLHNGLFRGSCITGPVGNSGTMLRMNNKGLAADADRDSGKWFFMRLYARNGVKLVDYVPAKRADGTIGFVDLAGREFATPTGGGQYTSDGAENGTVVKVIRYSATAEYNNNDVPVRGEWIGGASTNLTDTANWRCWNIDDEELHDVLPRRGATRVSVAGGIAFEVPVLELAIWKTISLNEVTLVGDCDWRGVPSATITGGAVDLNGHRLSVQASALNGTTYGDSSAGEPGELHITVANGDTVVNASSPLNGNLRLVKEGEGFFVPERKNQFYTGGTEILAGTIKATTCGTDYPLGQGDGRTVTVREGATFDIGSSYHFTVYPFVLDGGTFMASGTNGNMCRFGGTTLTADSVWDVYAANQFWCGHTLDLGGHTLKLNINNGSSMIFGYASDSDRIAITGGKINVTVGGWFIVNCPVDAPTMDLEFGPSPRFQIFKTLTIHDLLMNANDEGEWLHGEGTIKILGTFTPNTGYVHNYEMQDGSTIDLSGRSTVYPSVNPKKTQYKVGYASGATVTIDLHGHEYTMVPTLVMSWDEAPTGVTFVLDSQTRRKHYLKVADDGLYVANRGSTVLFIR